jgi:glycosyltransferase involved in cell wall biosynthesis
VIAASGPDAADCIEDGLTGRLVEEGDAGALAEAVESLTRHGDAARRLGAAAARRVHEVHAWQGVVEAVEAVYDDVLGLATFAPAEDSISRAGR